MQASSLSRNQLIEMSFNLSRASARFLLLMRIITDFGENERSLEQDIMDLYDYPERLQTSYLDEWRSWIKNT